MHENSTSQNETANRQRARVQQNLYRLFSVQSMLILHFAHTATMTNVHHPDPARLRTYFLSRIHPLYTFSICLSFSRTLHVFVGLDMKR